MSINPQYQALNKQVTALQSNLHTTMQSNPMAAALHHEVTALKNDIATGRNSVVLNERMKKINTMIQNDQKGHYSQAPVAPAAPASHYQPGTYQSGHYEAGHYQPGHYEPGYMVNSPQSTHQQNQMQHVGPSFTGNQSNNLRYNMRQMSATLNIHPKF